MSIDHPELTPWPEGFLDWLGLGTQYLASANALAKEVRDRKGWGTTTHGITVPLYLFRHGLELALKTYSVLFKIPIKNSHDIEKIGREISLLLPTLPVMSHYEADETVPLTVGDKTIDVSVGSVMQFALQAWEKKLPEVVEKYQNHLYIGERYSDPTNVLLRYPQNLELHRNLEILTTEQLNQIIKDIYDQFMLLQLVFAIKTGQPMDQIE